MVAQRRVDAQVLSTQPAARAGSLQNWLSTKYCAAATDEHSTPVLYGQHKASIQVPQVVNMSCFAACPQYQYRENMMHSKAMFLVVALVALAAAVPQAQAQSKQMPSAKRVNYAIIGDW